MEERGFPVCVENIATEAKTADLRKIFAQFGEVVEVTIVSNYGFVLYMDPDEAISAIRKGTGETLCGQKLDVKPTEELEKHFKEQNIQPDLKKGYNERRRSPDNHRDYHHDSRDREARGRSGERGSGGREADRYHRSYRGRNEDEADRHHHSGFHGRGRGYRGRGGGFGFPRGGFRTERHFYHHSDRRPSHDYSNRPRSRSPPSSPPRRGSHGSYEAGGHHDRRRSSSDLHRSPDSNSRRVSDSSRYPRSRSPDHHRYERRSRSPAPARHIRSPSLDTERRTRSRSAEGPKGQRRSRSRVRSPENRRSPDDRRNTPPSDDRRRRRSPSPRHESRSRSASREGHRRRRSYSRESRSLSRSPADPPRNSTPDRDTSSKDRKRTKRTTSDRQNRDIEDTVDRKVVEQDVDESIANTSVSHRPASPMLTEDIDSPEGSPETKEPATPEDPDTAVRSRAAVDDDKSLDLRELLKRKKAGKSVASSEVEENVVKVKAPKVECSIDGQIIETGYKGNVNSSFFKGKKVADHGQLKDARGSKAEREEDEVIWVPQVSNHPGCHVIFVGSILSVKPIELKKDIENLFDVYGDIKETYYGEHFAKLHIECDRETAEDLIKSLDWADWMGNKIRVKMAMEKKLKKFTMGFNVKRNDKYSHCDRDRLFSAAEAFREDSRLDDSRDRNPSNTSSTGSQEEREPRPKYARITTTVSTGKQRRTSSSSAGSCSEDSNQEPTTTTATPTPTPAAVSGGTSSSSNGVSAGVLQAEYDDEDLKPATKNVKPASTGERQVKARVIRVHCATSNKTYFTTIRDLFTGFGHVKVNVVSSAAGGVPGSSNTGTAEGETPIGVLPPSSSLGAFGAVPETAQTPQAMSSFIAKVQEMTKLPITAITAAAPPSAIAGGSGAPPPAPVEPAVAQGQPQYHPQATAASKQQYQPPAQQQQPQDYLQKHFQHPPPNIKQKSPSPPAAAPVSGNNFTTTASTVSSVVQMCQTDPTFLANVEGSIQSVSNKMVTVQFFNGCEWRLAKFVPGQMFINGKSCLGYALKNNLFHSWPSYIKGFLSQGTPVKMDVKKMSESEQAEVREICSDSVMYTTPLVWKVGVQKPNESVLAITTGLRQQSVVMKGVLTSLYPKWGILSTDKGEVFFEVSKLFVDNGFLARSGSLLKHLEKGDTLAVEAARVPYLELSDIARDVEGFTGRTDRPDTDSLKYHAAIVWHLAAEIDPYAIKNASKNAADEDDSEDEPAKEPSEIECNFLATSSTLFRPLPPSNDAQFRSWTGTVEEVRLPDGGQILLDGHLKLAPDHRFVYFHRSRLYVNGMKLPSSASIENEIVPGIDRVTVDVIRNNPSPSSISMENNYTNTTAHWVAVSVHLNTTERGVSIARNLKMEGYDEAVGDHMEKNVGVGRIVHFNPPATPEESTAVVSGTAVIDYGKYAGQRVEFESSNCHAWGNSLAKADLSQVFNENDRVYIEVKAYNSYCMERMWIGPKDVKVDSLDESSLKEFKKYLFDHGLDRKAFTSLCRGSFPSRNFIPYPGQIYRGKVKKLTSDLEDGAANLMTIEADIGQLFLLEARREDVYVHGHWMGKADLRYVLEDEDVMFEFHPTYDKSDASANSDRPHACLVWLGDEKSRPKYLGQGDRPQLSEEMDKILWDFVQKKGMDQKMFRSLVEGKLQPKGSIKVGQMTAVGPDGTPVSVDSETLQQAMLLQQFQKTFGKEGSLQAMMAAMMSMANPAAAAASDNSSVVNDNSIKQALEMAQKMQAAKAIEPTASTMKQAVAGPSGSLTFPAVEQEKKISFSMNSRKKL